MLQTKWLVFFIAAFLIGGFFSGLIEMTYLGQNAGMGLLSPFFMWTKGSFTLNLIKGITMIFSGELINVLFRMFFWDYAMFTGVYEIVRYLLIGIISVPMAVTFGLTVIGIARGSGT